MLSGLGKTHVTCKIFVEKLAVSPRSLLRPPAGHQGRVQGKAVKIKLHSLSFCSSPMGSCGPCAVPAVRAPPGPGLAMERSSLLRAGGMLLLALLPAASIMGAASTSAATEAAPMSANFATWADLEAANGVGGVSWEALQRRCQPGAGPGQSSGGWISDGTPLLEVLRQDWDAVRQLGTTHLELAAHLDAVWAAATPCDFDHPKAEVDYDVRSLKQNTLPSNGPVRLKLSCLHTRGMQQDLLKPNDFGEAWNVQWTVGDGDVELSIGGRDSTAGILEYARLFGFYEGGAGNAFRLDPAKVVRLLTGGAAAPPTSQ